MEQPKRILSREELHDLVWSTPMQKLAESYGLSDRGLAKICERHLVPPPPRGYWAKVQAGQPAKKPKLRSVENSALHTVHIGTKVVTPQSTYLAEVLAAARLEVAREDRALAAEPTAKWVTQPPTPKMTEPTVQSSKLSPAVNAFIAELRKQKPDADGFVALRSVKVTPADVERLGRLINDLASALEPYGFVFEAREHSIGFSKSGTRVHFRINAPRKRLVTTSRGGWQSFEYKHAGRFSMRVYGDAEGSTKNWSDTDHRKIEKAIEQMVESFRLNFIVGKERDEQRRQQETRRAHMTHRRELATLRQKREEDRLTFLRWIADARREADDLRATIATVPQSGELPPDYKRMIVWARNRLAELEEKTAIERVQTTLMERQLYTDPDHLLDPEGEPPPKKNYWDD